MISEEKIIFQLKNALELDDVYVQSEDGKHVDIIAVSDQFAGMSRVKKQQTIYAPLAKYIADGHIHAVSVKTYTTEEWRSKRKLLGL